MNIKIGGDCQERKSEKLNSTAAVLGGNPELTVRFWDEGEAGAASSQAFSEFDHQAKLEQWKADNLLRIPELKRLWANPNGQYRPGQRMEPLTVAGVPDLSLMVARGKWHGMLIELKKPGREGERRGGLSEEQDGMLAELSIGGYHCVVAYGWESARDMILDYLELNDADS